MLATKIVVGTFENEIGSEEVSTNGCGDSMVSSIHESPTITWRM